MGHKDNKNRTSSRKKSDKRKDKWNRNGKYTARSIRRVISYTKTNNLQERAAK